MIYSRSVKQTVEQGDRSTSVPYRLLEPKRLVLRSRLWCTTRLSCLHPSGTCSRRRSAGLWLLSRIRAEESRREDQGHGENKHREKRDLANDRVDRPDGSSPRGCFLYCISVDCRFMREEYDQER